MIETVGGFAGLIAMIGLVVLSYIVIAQARDLRRLREWAGGAPERDAELREVSEAVAEERAEEIREATLREERRLVRTGEIEPSFWERLGRSGQVMLVLAGLIVVGAGAAWLLLGGTGGSSSGEGTAGGNGGSSEARENRVDVAVLNGTGGAEAGLAAEYAAFLEKEGYRIGVTADAPETYDQTVAFFGKGDEGTARKVATDIGASETAPIPPEIKGLVSGAGVVAVIGLDHSDLPSQSG